MDTVRSLGIFAPSKAFCPCKVVYEKKSRANGPTAVFEDCVRYRKAKRSCNFNANFQNHCGCLTDEQNVATTRWQMVMYTGQLVEQSIEHA